MQLSTETTSGTKHESNSPSRFIKEIDSEYVANPLRNDDFADSTTDDDFPGFGGFGSRGFGSGHGSDRFSGGGSGRYSGGNYGGGSGRFGGSHGTGSGRYSGGNGRPANRFGMGGGNPYGSSGSVRYESRQTSAASPTASRIEALRNRPLPPKISDADFVPAPMTDFKTGQRIEHNRFGPGKILEITGTAPDLKARIAFDSYGEKLLLLKYAKMRVV